MFVFKKARQAVIHVCSSSMLKLDDGVGGLPVLCRVKIASIHCVRSNSDDKKNVYKRAVGRFFIRNGKLGETNTN